MFGIQNAKFCRHSRLKMSRHLFKNIWIWLQTVRHLCGCGSAVEPASCYWKVAGSILLVSMSKCWRERYIHRSSTGRSWSVLVGPGGSWGVLVSPGWSWLVLVGPGQSWSVLGGPGRFWSVLGGPGWSWAVLGGPGHGGSSLQPPGDPAHHQQ